MEQASNDKKLLIVSWVCQIIAAAILGGAAWGKIAGSENSIYVFEVLEMEPTGRILIGMIEALSAVMLLTANIPYLGAFLGFAVMIGAAFAHLFVLGFNVHGDGGTTVMMLLVVVTTTCLVMYIHRKKLPFVGKTLE